MATSHSTNPLTLLAFNVAPSVSHTADIRELIGLTDDELIGLAVTQGDVSALALELMERLVQAKDYIAELEELAGLRMVSRRN